MPAPKTVNGGGTVTQKATSRIPKGNLGKSQHGSPMVPGQPFGPGGTICGTGCDDKC